jgi:hypothetical protein
MITDKKDIQWRRKIFIPNPIVLQEQLQEKHAISTPISYFKKYFTAELFGDYSKMTNVYALQNNVVFKPTDVMEMRQLFGLHMYMGCEKTASIKDVLVSCDGLRKVSKKLNNVFEALFSAAQQPSYCKQS